MAEKNPEMYLGWEALFALENGCYIYLQNTIDDPDYDYSYSLFWPDRHAIDGGYLNIEEEPKSIEEVLEAALQACNLPKGFGRYRLDDDDEPIDLEELGYTGY